MTMKTNTFDAARRAFNSTARATIREVDDGHLMQEVKQADVHHQETPTNFERMQHLGFTSVPLKQDEDQQQQQPQQGGTGNGAGGAQQNKQPQGPAAEAIILYIGGNREHPVAIGIDDRRVRPYGMKPGQGAHYSPDGSGQMVFHKADGLYVVTLDDQQDSSGQSGSGAGAGGSGGTQQQQTRVLSLRHVEKKKQSRKIQKSQPGQGGQQGQQQQSDYKHEGDTVNVEVRLSKGRIEFRAGDGVVGYYDVANQKWTLYSGSESNSVVVDKQHTHIKHGSNAIFVDDGGCWSTSPIELKSDTS
jgi:phage gp45-like